MRIKLMASMMLALALTGCADETDETARQATFARPTSTQAKYRIVQIYGAARYGTQFDTYYADDVKYDGNWVKFYDKERRQWTRLSGSVLVEGGEN